VALRRKLKLPCNSLTEIKSNVFGHYETTQLINGTHVDGAGIVFCVVCITGLISCMMSCAASD